jgi:membrane protein YdbS with pleckstrin-like domain
MYRGIWTVLVKLFRVPAEPPSLPARDGELVQSFQPAEGFLKYLKFWFWLLFWPMDVVILIAWIAIFVAVWWLALLLAIPALLLAIVPDIFVFIGLHLRFDTTWYVMTDRSLRIRRGIWSIEEVTITFENVQNISLRQGPLQRHFGIANLMVETAGGSAPQGKHGQTMSHRGVIEGIANAKELRDRIMLRLRESKTAGLGDEAHAHEHDRGDATGPNWTAEHMAALRAIRDEARLLAATAAGRS